MFEKILNKFKGDKEEKMFVNSGFISYKMESKINEFMTTLIPESSFQNFSHLLHNPKRKVKQAPNTHTKFWRYYCDLVSEQSPIAISERPGQHVPLIVEFVFRFQRRLCEDEDVITDVVISRLCWVIQRVMLDYLSIDEEDHSMLTCFVLSPEVPLTTEKEIINTVRFQFPLCKLDISYVQEFFYDQLIDFCFSNNLVSIFRVSPSGDCSTWLNRSLINQPVPMYGSRIHDVPLLLWSVFEELTDEESLDEDCPTIEDFMDLFELSNHTDVYQKLLNPSFFYENEDKLYYLPIVLSLHFGYTVTQPRSECVSPTSTVEAIESTEEQKIVYDMISMLKPFRSTTRFFWKDIGKALYNVTRGSEEGLRRWVEFTKKGKSELTEEDCKLEYETFSQINKLTYRTVAWYASLDNPIEYKNWHNRWCEQSMKNALTCTDFDIAFAFYRRYWLKYICSDTRHKSWYRFERGFWVPTQPIVISNIIMSDFRILFEKYRADLAKTIVNITEERDKNDKEGLIKLVTSLITKLKSNAVASRITTVASGLFIKDDFEDIRDTNWTMLGVGNGVLDMDEKGIIFREGKPEDYITIRTSIPYLPTLTRQSPSVINVMKWLSQLFPDRELLHYTLKLLAKTLRGKNLEKIFPVFSGENGDNGKSTLMKALEILFGPYFVKFTPSILSGKRQQANGPSPEIAQAKYARIGVVDEPNNSDELNDGDLKRFTGNDSMFARLLNQNGGKFDILFLFIYICNKPPNVPANDKAVRNRLKIVPFLTTYVDDPPATIEEQWKQRRFPKEADFERKLPHMINALLWLLVDYYPVFCKEGIQTSPPVVTQTTEFYWKTNDYYSLFISENIRELKGSEISVKMSYDKFTKWFIKSYPSKRDKIPDRTFFTRSMNSHFGTVPRKGVWVGFEMIEETL